MSKLIKPIQLIKPALLNFKFENFELLIPSSEPFEELLTDSHGRDWYLYLYIGGDYVSLSIDGDYFYARTEKYTLTLTIRSSSGDQDVVWELEHLYDNITERFDSNLTRSQIVDKDEGILINGALHVDLLIQTKPILRSYLYPPNPLANKILALCESATDSDVSFSVQNEVIKAHSLILKLNAPVLAEFFQNNTTLIINDAPADVFKVALSYVYGNCELDDATMVKFGKDLITVADKYELLQLKEIVEHALVRNCVIRKTNVSDYILFAAAKNCPMLKEYAVSFFVLNAQDVLKSESSLQLRESVDILTELMIAMGNELIQVTNTCAKKG